VNVFWLGGDDRFLGLKATLPDHGEAAYGSVSMVEEKSE